jgi:hypothetical protein
LKLVFALTFRLSLRQWFDGATGTTNQGDRPCRSGAQLRDHDMNPITTIHAGVRAQQRGVPPLVLNWLLDYGEETFDGHGGVLRYFTPRSIRNLEREVGQAPIKRLSEYLRCYLVQGSQDGIVITVGKRHRGKRICRH